MSELPELPPAARLHRPPPPDGLERAVADGRRRRARFVGGAAGGTALTVVLLGALLATPGARNDSLQVASPAPTPVSSNEPSPEPAPASSPDPGEVSPEPQGAGSPQPRPTGPPPDGEVGSSPAPDEQQPQGGVAGPPPPDQRPAYREITDEDAAGHEFCTPTKVATGGCAYTTDNGPVVQRGTPVTAATGSCSGPDSAGVNVYEFAGGQETELVVLQGEREVFRFSSTVRYVDGPHERRLRGGRCLEFRQVWRGVDTAGNPVPAGDYRVVFTVHPSGVRYDFEDGTSMREKDPHTNTNSFAVTLVD